MGELSLPIYTSYFSNKTLYDGSYTLVNIATKQPKWLTETLPTYQPAVPNKSTVYDWYGSNKNEAAIVKYIQQYYYTKLSLGRINPEMHKEYLISFSTVMRELYGAKPIVMLCYEKVGDFCHRFIYATYIKLTTGIDILEFPGKSDIREENITQKVIIRTLEKLIGGNHINGNE